jgi:hypothetical protein
VSSDPLTDGVARLLTVPLCELYAVLWRIGIVDIVDKPSSASEAA